MDPSLLKECHRMFYAVKGHLIPEGWKEDDILKMYDSYVVRMWDNHEFCYYLHGFEDAWNKRYSDKPVSTKTTYEEAHRRYDRG